MHNIVGDVAILRATHQRKLAGTGFNAEYPFVVGDALQESVKKCGFARACGTCHYDRYAVTHTHLQKSNHFFSAKVCFKQLFPIYLVRVKQTDRTSYSDVFVNNRFFKNRYTSIAGEVPLCHRSGVIDNHPAVM